MKILSNSWNGLYNRYCVLIETKQGKRYYATYTTKVTDQEIREDWKENRNCFNHIN
jgi:hypothetical protein